jgi:hypothetical protein
MFDEVQSLPEALHGLAYIQRQILSTNSYKVHIGQCTAAVSSIQWMLDYFAKVAIASGMSAVPAETRSGSGPQDRQPDPQGDAPNLPGASS